MVACRFEKKSVARPSQERPEDPGNRAAGEHGYRGQLLSRDLGATIQLQRGGSADLRRYRPLRSAQPRNSMRRAGRDRLEWEPVDDRAFQACDSRARAPPAAVWEPHSFQGGRRSDLPLRQSRY
jgi:hypothetical protein